MADTDEGTTDEGATPETEEPTNTSTGDTPDDANTAGAQPKPETGAADDIAKMQAALKKANDEAKRYRLRVKELEPLEQAKKDAADADKSELQKLAEQLQELQAENETNKVKALRSEVARTTGVPAELLSATTEDELNEQAEALLAYAEAELEKRKTPDKPAAAPAAKPKEKLRSGAAGSGKGEMSREDVLAAVLGKSRK
jgi:chromosome segregation ATPase